MANTNSPDFSQLLNMLGGQNGSNPLGSLGSLFGSGGGAGAATPNGGGATPDFSKILSFLGNMNGGAGNAAAATAASGAATAASGAATAANGAAASGGANLAGTLGSVANFFNATGINPMDALKYVFPNMKGNANTNNGPNATPPSQQADMQPQFHPEENESRGYYRPEHFMPRQKGPSNGNNPYYASNMAGKPMGQRPMPGRPNQQQKNMAMANQQMAGQFILPDFKEVERMARNWGWRKNSKYKYAMKD